MNAGLAHRFDQSVLREYDIRGIVGRTLSGDDAFAVGRGFGTAVRERGGRRVACGRDGRLHSPDLQARLIAGLTSTGLEVVDIGLGPTPMLYFAAHTLGVDAGIQVTGSHNPAEYNGFKMLIGGKSFWGDDIRRMGARCAAGDFATGTGGVASADVIGAYLERLLRDYRPGRDLTVVWDAGNGAGGEIMRLLAGRLPGRHVPITPIRPWPRTWSSSRTRSRARAPISGWPSTATPIASASWTGRGGSCGATS